MTAGHIMNKKKCTVLEGENFERPKQKISNEDSANFPVFPTGEGSGSQFELQTRCRETGNFYGECCSTSSI